MATRALVNARALVDDGFRDDLHRFGFRFVRRPEVRTQRRIDGSLRPWGEQRRSGRVDCGLQSVGRHLPLCEGQQRVSFAVENASLADLIAAALRGTGCEAEIRESRVILKRSVP